ncbi:hypothetical protein BTHE68_38930 [Burkholderia sp. THE68]|uniref:hypothetical protein n=1 Tax=Burkholderiaceae TaxID=119060 RepID=UPI001317CA56|nr:MULTISPECIES: hypothetical protein [Burkholderiaceae]BBU30159.1 hypothetical protein BTHE68_38930 [Burkholderia sp. THE68]BCQ26010.1 hypothetical protein NK8_41940 [Caballeronia sp. NK8]
MNATTKKLVISALVLGLSGGAYAQAGGSMGGGGNGSSGSGSAAAGKGGGVGMSGTGMGGSSDGTAGTGAKSGMGNDATNGMSQDQNTIQRSAPNNGNMNSGGTPSKGTGTQKGY